MRFIWVTGYTFILAISSFSKGWSQELISAAGDEFATAGLTMAWSLGETIIETEAYGEMMLTQGFHQPGIVEKPVLESVIRVYPNPYDMILVIEIAMPGSENMACKVVDMSGKTVMLISGLKAYNEIATSDMSDGVYILRIYDAEGRMVKSVKIIKLYQV